MYRTVKDVRFPLSVRNEVAAMERLLALTKGALAAYPTTVEEDQAALKVRAARPPLWCKDHPSCALNEKPRYPLPPSLHPPFSWTGRGGHVTRRGFAARHNSLSRCG